MLFRSATLEGFFESLDMNVKHAQNLTTPKRCQLKYQYYRTIELDILVDVTPLPTVQTTFSTLNTWPQHVLFGMSDRFRQSRNSIRVKLH